MFPEDPDGEDPDIPTWNETMSAQKLPPVKLFLRGCVSI
jgi:hypothetical protein